MSVNVEILAHISAPTTRQRDDEYRAQAAAYLAFEPHDIGTKSKQLGNAPGKLYQGIILSNEVNGITTVTSVPGDLSDTQERTSHTPPSRPAGRLKKREILFERQDSESFGSFPTGILSFEEDEHQKIERSQFQNGMPDVTSNHAADDDLDSSLQDAQMVVTALETQLLEPYLSSDIGDRVAHLSSKDSGGPRAFFRDAFPSSENNHSNNDNHGHASISADINSPGPNGTRQGHVRSSISQNEVMRSVSISTSKDSSSLAREVQVSTGMDAIPKSTRPRDASLVKIPAAAHPPIEIQAFTSAPRKDLSTADENYGFGSLPTEVIPPAPEVGTTKSATWPSQSTPIMEAMVTNEGNIGRYNPKMLMRRPEMDERGFWRIETSSWPRKIQHQFWTSMVTHIRKGHFGWGITMHREPRLFDDGTIDDSELGLVRLYCWGELVEHTYLFLWLSSAGKVLNSGLQWIDADNLVVVHMP
jgi:hypothetical protein